MRATSALLVLATLVACGRTPRDDYDDYLERANRLALDEGVEPDGARPPAWQDVTGSWLLQAKLALGNSIWLRVRMCAPVANPTQADWDRCDPATGPGPLMVRMWLDRQVMATDAPIVETSTDVDAEGHFLLVADPLKLPKEIIGFEIVARVEMYARTAASGAWCGDATGVVTSPPGIPLDGSTFAALRDPDQTLTRADTVWECRGVGVEVPGDDAGPGTDTGPSTDGAPTGDLGPDPGPARPESPDLSAVPSVQADLTGHYLLTAELPIGLALQLWLSVVSAYGDAGGTLDGAVHAVMAAPGTPALATFTTTLTTDGRFEVWLPNALLPSSLGEVEADILLAGATLDSDRFCGEAAGAVTRPLPLMLAGTRFGAQRFVPGGPVTPAAEALAACPDVP
jgi:hypothetical protein